MEKDHLNLKAAIDDILAAKVDDALEARKEYVGRNMFNPNIEDSEEPATDEESE